MLRQTPSEKIDWKKHNFPIVVIAENIHSPYNVGLIVRTCECFGIERIYFSGPSSNNQSEKFKKTARAAQKYIGVVAQEDTISVIQGLISQQYRIIALEITDESENLSEFIVPENEKIALLIGSERHGISETSLKVIEKSIHIEQFGSTGSHNVGIALSIALYEITKQMRS